MRVGSRPKNPFETCRGHADWNAPVGSEAHFDAKAADVCDASDQHAKLLAEFEEAARSINNIEPLHSSTRALLKESDRCSSTGDRCNKISRVMGKLLRSCTLSNAERQFLLSIESVTKPRIPADTPPEAHRDVADVRQQATSALINGQYFAQCTAFVRQQAGLHREAADADHRRILDIIHVAASELARYGQFLPAHQAFYRALFEVAEPSH